MTPQFRQTLLHKAALFLRVSKTAVLSHPWSFLAIAASLALQGCALAPVEFTRADEPPPPVVAPTAAVAPPAPVVPAAAVQVASDEVDLMPPVPSFTTLEDCESAYGPNACGSGEAVYLTAGIAAPVGAEAWFIPYAFGAMTGVLVNHYFAPPAYFVAGIDYRAFTARAVVAGYKTINRGEIDRYRHAPVDVRSRLVHSGPARYSPSRGMITGRFNRAGSATHPSVPLHRPLEAGERRPLEAAPHRPVDASAASYEHRNASNIDRPHTAGPNADERGNPRAGMAAQSPGRYGDSRSGMAQVREQQSRPQVSPLQQTRFQESQPGAYRSMPTRPVAAPPRAAVPTARPAARMATPPRSASRPKE